MLQAVKCYLVDVYSDLTACQVKSASVSYDGDYQLSTAATFYIYAVGDQSMDDGGLVKVHFNLIVDHANQLAIMSYSTE